MPPQMKLTLEEKIEVILICGENRSCRQAAEIFNGRHPNKAIHNSTVLRLLNKFKLTGSVENRHKVPHIKTATNEENTFNVLLSVAENPRAPLSERKEQVDMSSRSIGRILKQHRFIAYKPKFIHTLFERDLDARIDFSFWFQGMIESDRNFAKKVLFTDESTFTSNGIVSSQNCRWWADENPNFTIEARNQYSFKTNVWCGIINTKIIGPYFFRNNLNSARYLQFLSNELMDDLHELPLLERHEMFFQQDGASIHSTVAVRQWLDTNFPGKWIGRYSVNPWPARSPDLTPMDFFLWGYLKTKVYKHRPFINVDHLEDTIRYHVENITPAVLIKVRKAMEQKTITCIERDGRHVE